MFIATITVNSSQMSFNTFKITEGRNITASNKHRGPKYAASQSFLHFLHHVFAIREAHSRCM